MKVIGLPSCIRTTPILVSNASHSITKSLVKLCNAKMGGLVMASFRVWKARVVASVQVMESFL